MYIYRYEGRETPLGFITYIDYRLQTITYMAIHENFSSVCIMFILDHLPMVCPHKNQLVQLSDRWGPRLEDSHVSGKLKCPYAKSTNY